MSDVMSLPDFLEASKKTLKDEKSKGTVHIVLGNESCDLDSAVSAVVYAYLLHLLNDDDQVQHVPVLHIPSSDYSIHTEVKYALTKHHITQTQLSFLDELNLRDLFDAGRLRVTLVDLNVLRGPLSYLEKVVCEVLDHHKKEREDSERVECRIEPVGSCATLVAEAVLKHDQLEIPQDIYSLLYGTILMDTVCLAESAGKATPKDQKLVGDLEVKLGDMDRKAVFDELQSAKLDVSGLNTTDILLKDLKKISNNDTTIAISSIPISLTEFLARDDVLSSFEAFCDHQASVLIIMSLFMVEDLPRRQLAVFSPQPNLIQKLSTLLVNSSLDLTPLPSSLSHIQAYTQCNIKASRKFVLPLIKEYLES